MATSLSEVTPPATPCPHCGFTTRVPYHWPPFPNRDNYPTRVRFPEDTAAFLANRWRCAECLAMRWRRLEKRWRALRALHKAGIIRWPANEGPKYGWWCREEWQYGRTP